MSFQRISRWLLSESGQTCLFVGAGVASISTILINVLPHTILLDQYMRVVHLYKKGFYASLNTKIVDRFYRAIELSGVDEDCRTRYKPFAYYGFDIFSAGSSSSKFGVIVGIPPSFSYETVDDIDKFALRLGGELTIVWDSDEGKQLANALILSENAQVYAMAREIKFRDTLKLYIDTLVSTICVSGAYGLSKEFNKRLKLLAKPRSVRFVSYALVCAFSYASYALCKDFSTMYYEGKIDAELAAANPIFREGGQEFYEKILERNKSLRKMFGREGEQKFNSFGAENHLFRQKHLPLLQRLDFFKNVDAQVGA